MDDLKLLVELMARSLVDQPNAVIVEEKIGSQTTLLSLKVAKDDIGKVIGKQGATAGALRTIVKAAGARFKKRYHLDIVE